jgi:hypothetical protein
VNWLEEVNGHEEERGELVRKFNWLEGELLNRLIG